MTVPLDAQSTSCCWPECDQDALLLEIPWNLCFSHTGRAHDVVVHIRTGVPFSEPLPVAELSKERKDARTQTRNIQKASIGAKGWVYYARVGDRIKIGYSTNVRRRMGQYPPGSVLLAVEPGTKAMESTRHKQFFHLLDAAREWFRQDDELKAHIAKIRSRWGDLSDMQKARVRGKDTVKPKPSGRAYR